MYFFVFFDTNSWKKKMAKKLLLKKNQNFFHFLSRKLKKFLPVHEYRYFKKSVTTSEKTWKKAKNNPPNYYYIKQRFSMNFLYTIYKKMRKNISFSS